MSNKRQRLIGGEHGRRLPTLEAKIYSVNGMEEAAPYLKHMAMAAPYLADSIPDILPGMLLPSVASLKPPAARKAPTRTNLFKASRTLSSNKSCNMCPLSDGSILVFHHGTTPPTTYLCTPGPIALANGGVSPVEYLAPYSNLEYQVEASSQFTLVTNAAASLALEITSFAASNPLNGQMTSAHLMDIDDATVYSTGSFELVSTTPKDALSSTSLARGLVTIMGPESFSTVLYNPDHPPRFQYPGWSLSSETTSLDNDELFLYMHQMTSHRWFVNTTFEVTAHAQFPKPVAGGNFIMRAIVTKAICPDPAKCPTTNNLPTEEVVFACSVLAKPYSPMSSDTEAAMCLTISGVFSTSKTQNLVGFHIDWAPTVAATPKMNKLAVHVKTCVQNPEMQFGPCFIGRFEGITDSIVIQANVRAAVSGIQSGSSRSVAPPTTPSHLSLGTEDTVLVQSLFDAPTTPLARVMTTEQYRMAGGQLANMSRSLAVSHLDAAPIGDTIRGIGSTISRIGHSLGGPFSTIGDIINTVGGIAGGIGDAIGGIFSAPQGTIMAAPEERTGLLHRGFSASVSDTASAYQQPFISHAEVAKGVYADRGWSVVMTSVVTGRDFKIQRPKDAQGYRPEVHPATMQAFPWVSADTGASGVSNIYCTSMPMTTPDRSVVKYHACQMVLPESNEPYIAFYIDERLVKGNKPEYVSELAGVIELFNLQYSFVTTDALAPIFGDSMSAALLASIMFPSLGAAVTGGVRALGSNSLGLSPVGLLNAKAQAAMDAGLILICPPEAVSDSWRTGTTGTPCVTVQDIMLGILTETPRIIMAANMLELYIACTFVEASKNAPLSEEEAQAQASEKAANISKQKEVLDSRASNATAGKTEEQIAAIADQTFTVEVPGMDNQPIPLLSEKWWSDHQATLTVPAAQRGIGSSMNKVRDLIAAGNVGRLTGLAKAVLSREAKSAKGGGKVRSALTTARSRLPAFKQPRSADLANLIARIQSTRTEPMESTMDDYGPAPEIDQASTSEQTSARPIPTTPLGGRGRGFPPPRGTQRPRPYPTAK